MDKPEIWDALDMIRDTMIQVRAHAQDVLEQIQSLQDEIQKDIPQADKE